MLEGSVFKILYVLSCVLTGNETKVGVGLMSDIPEDYFNLIILGNHMGLLAA